MRKTRVIENCRCYHLVSRLAHQAFFLDDEEKTRAVELLRRVEEFSGVLVLAYAIMSNHFHFFVYVPEPEQLDDAEIVRRIKVLYRGASLSQVLGEWERLKEEETKLQLRARPNERCVSRFGEYRQSFLRRMWNSSEFMRTFKQHFTMSFNGRREHSGTMFEGRYHERHHKPERAVMWRTAAYVDVNPVKAGAVERPEDYPWCSFAAAVKGEASARRGYAFMYGNGDWKLVRKGHEKSMGEVLGAASAERRDEQSACEPEAEFESNRRPQAAGAKVGGDLEIPRSHSFALERGNPEVAERICALLADGPMSPAALREAVGIRSRIHFNRYYVAPLLAQGVIARSDPEHPKSPQQEYRLA